MKFLRNLLKDLATLKKPVTAASLVATAVELASPFGLDVGPAGAKITGALVVVGVIAAYVEHLSQKR